MAPISTKKIKSKNPVSAPEVKIDKNMKSYTNDPFFVKKAQDAKAFIESMACPKN